MTVTNKTEIKLDSPPIWYTAVLLILSFAIPYCVLLAVMAGQGFYPFGEKSLLIMDMDGQYADFYQALKQIVSGEGSIFFSWNKSMGTSFIGLYAYYLASPLSFILLLFDDILLGLFQLTLIKAALCGFTSCLYFRDTFALRNHSVLFFSLSYALMSYTTLYSQCLMWLDGVILLPLVLLGGEKLLRREKPWLLIGSLTLLLHSNYYIAYMVCLFSVLFLLYRYLTTEQTISVRHIRKTAGRFALCYLTAIGLSMWFLLPVVYDLAAGKLGYGSYVPEKITNFSPLSYIQAVWPGQYTSITNLGLPVLYTGAGAALLCGAFFFLRDIGRGKKCLTLGFFAFLLLSFCLIGADMVWHGFQYPSWFPFRYAFVFQFLVVFVACNAFVVLTHHGAAAERLRNRTLPALWVWLVLAAIAVDLGFNASALFKGLDGEFPYGRVSEYNDFINQNAPVLQQLQQSDSDFYRIEKTYQRSYNDALGLGYKGIAHYSSAFNASILSFFRKMGFAQAHFWNAYRGSTPVTDALFSVKYVLSPTEWPYDEFFRHEETTVYQNPYWLPLGFMTEIEGDVPMAEGDGFANQNALIKAFWRDAPDCFIPVDSVEQTEGLPEYSFVAAGDNPVYIHLPDSINYYGSLFVNGVSHGSYFTNEDNGIVRIGRFEPGQRVTLSTDADPAITQPYAQYIYYLDEDALAQVVEKLAQGGLNVTAYNSTSVTGQVNAAQSGVMFVSIPYDKGFHVEVDGQRVKTDALDGTFLTFPVEAGNHDISITYHPRGLTAGICLSLAVLLVIVLLLLGKFFELPLAFSKQAVYNEQEPGGESI